MNGPGHEYLGRGSGRRTRVELAEQGHAVGEAQLAFAAARRLARSRSDWREIRGPPAIVKTKAGHFEPSKFEDQYEDALKELLKKKQEGKPIERPERPKPTNVVNLMDALRQSVEASGASTASKPKADAPARRTAHEKTEQPKRKKARRTG